VLPTGKKAKTKEKTKGKVQKPKKKKRDGPQHAETGRNTLAQNGKKDEEQFEK